ncbi:hypothetical protein P8V03_11705 [Clostridium sp. A1-XYC3]|uniref:Transposase n=1 Tax=Clostridium tanneri TaxID=3037988 RepID=A0ABU4JUH7_9CLOT|nr:hypothetical protein [Clostridium sp. A1-XYC3]MDW8801810.1 hypothetical protein [Clostridium sp. A1-XYC3]
MKRNVRMPMKGSVKIMRFTLDIRLQLVLDGFLEGDKALTTLLELKI